jgi:hypothetical protein
MATVLHVVQGLRMSEVMLPLPPYVFMGLYLAKYRDNFTLYTSTRIADAFSDTSRMN